MPLLTSFSFQNRHLGWTARPQPGTASPGRRGVARTLTFMVGGAVRGGDSGRSGTVTSVLFSSSCFLKNQTQAYQLPPRLEQEREAGDKGLSSLAKPRACGLPVK